MNWDKVIDRIQVGLLWFVVVFTVLSILVLIGFDFLAGTGVMLYLTNGNKLASPAISMATSGLLVVVMFMAYTMGENKKKHSTGAGSYVFGAIGLGIMVLDVYFDSLTADYLRYGYIVAIKDITQNANIHIAFRSLIGGISFVGEPLGMSIILGMPVLKGILNNAIPESMRKSTPVPAKPQQQGMSREERERKHESLRSEREGIPNRPQGSMRPEFAQKEMGNRKPDNPLNRLPKANNSPKSFKDDGDGFDDSFNRDN